MQSSQLTAWCFGLYLLKPQTSEALVVSLKNGGLRADWASELWSVSVCGDLLRIFIVLL